MVDSRKRVEDINVNCPDSMLGLVFSVIGNQVNVAARLGSRAKSGQILVSQRTHSMVKDLVELEKMGEIQVKGIHSPMSSIDLNDFNDLSHGYGAKYRHQTVTNYYQRYAH